MLGAIAVGATIVIVVIGGIGQRNNRKRRGGCVGDDGIIAPVAPPLFFAC